MLVEFFMLVGFSVALGLGGGVVGSSGLGPSSFLILFITYLPAALIYLPSGVLVSITPSKSFSASYILFSLKALSKGFFCFFY